MGGEVDYPETAERFDIRPVTNAEREAVNEVVTNSPDTGEVSFAPRFEVDPCTTQEAMSPNADIEVLLAEAPDGTPAGTGMVVLDEVRVHGEHRPGATLVGLAVRPEYRGEGLATRLATERIRHAETQAGNDVVVTAGIQSGNEPSRAVAESWAEGFPYETVTVSQQPHDSSPDDGHYDIRAASREEYDTIAEQRDSFYADAELFPLRDGDQLRDAVESSGLATERPVNQYLVAIDDGDIVAGALVRDQHELMHIEVTDTPGDGDDLPPTIPDSGEIRVTGVGSPWFGPGYEAAAEALLNHIRARDETGNRVSMVVDPSGPLSPLFDSTEVAVEAHWAVRGLEEPHSDGFVAPET